ncbi:amino acid/amide ABC transporter membrane protein 2 (HAAT family) /amino acid/amide ABC transporter ATP-binding protein 1 (HAAT family) [Roseovarius halotolerans]|uniref:Lipopolysaccharide export system ATP-binding protein LptB n=1 Tax=Roseovarius halotolerans TaxID=505353 RepID=A0A1X6YC73_9RHOB|nr:branched-chain amino acid ABC transporter ATP-binding protein/permease [Roseovarius halotolerans]RKT34959.1 amino acid/amide ABC transporter membrane protein 2 (HAAT family) /amino acid/amide ABC transporter ATP-binding protein 1 (HAAT family) [Roseovarius halotolerans]SLN16214.1 Lipopolysaccharide export system ATP-binding protein LptB [Roseovarius halotolerans]
MSKVFKSLIPFGIFAVAYLALSMVVTNSYYQFILTMVLVWASFGLSWNMLSGYTGLISFGHASFFGLGAFATVLAHYHLGISPWIMLPVSALIGATAGVLIGLPTFRLRGHYFALSMLAYPLAFMYVFQWLGYPEISLPRERENPAAYMQFDDGRIYTLLAMLILAAIVVLTRIIETRRFGMALIAIKQNEAAAEAAGINTLGWKLAAIAVSGGIAGLVGAFYSVVILVITPHSVFGMLISAQALTVTMFGGVGTVWGPIIGASFLIPIAETLHAELGSYLPGIQGVVYGIAIVVLIIAAPEGLYWKARDLFRGRSGTGGETEMPKSETPADAEALATVTPLPTQFRTSADADAEPVLEVDNLSKSFGGLKAVQNVSFKVPAGMILGIIGPNGAGKTTLFNLLNGFQKPDEGRVRLNGGDVLGEKPHAICRAGVGRTFQIMRPFKRMSVHDNVKVGAYVHAASEDEAEEITRAALHEAGLDGIAERMAGGLTTKDLRLMELARALAGRPEILLLDETLAGLGKHESEEVIAIIRRLAKSGKTIVIIEHTMQAMVQLVDRFLVLDHGEVVTEGEPEAVTRDPRVIEAYLGKKWASNA